MRLYVTGGTGLVGSNIIRLARARGGEIIASQYGPEPEWRVDYELDPLNLADHDAIRASILKYKPDAVIHCAAILDQLFMRANRELCWSIMVEGTRALAEACREVGARLVFVSSDWVFDGQVDLVDETSPPNPVNFYGVMKMASERDLAAMDGLNYGIGRLAWHLRPELRRPVAGAHGEWPGLRFLRLRHLSAGGRAASGGLDGTQGQRCRPSNAGVGLC